jgi:hypothetical protein
MDRFSNEDVNTHLSEITDFSEKLIFSENLAIAITA